MLLPLPATATHKGMPQAAWTASFVDPVTSPSSGTTGREQSAERLMGEASTSVLDRLPSEVRVAQQAGGAEAAKR